MRLTDEQKEVVEENHDLIYWYIHKRNLNIDEYYDLLAIELCKSVIKFDESRGSLSNYFKLRADWTVSREYTKNMTQKRNHISVRLTDKDMPTHTVDVCNDLYMKEWLKKAGIEYDILSLRVQGYSQSEIAQRLGVSQPYISKVLKKLKSEWEDDNNE